MIGEGALEPRPGVARLLAELANAGCRLGVATTGSRGWVDQLLERLLPGVDFDVVVTGDEVAGRKPDPEAYVVAMEGLRTTTADTVAVEDSHEGLAVGHGGRAGLRGGDQRLHRRPRPDRSRPGTGRFRRARPTGPGDDRPQGHRLPGDPRRRNPPPPDRVKGHRGKGGGKGPLYEAPSREGGFTPRHGALAALPEGFRAKTGFGEFFFSPEVPRLSPGIRRAGDEGAGTPGRTDRQATKEPIRRSERGAARRRRSKQLTSGGRRGAEPPDYS